ncbi:MerR family transcriptional regulator [Paenibacillus sp. FSL R10-2734]|uniref:MerR family transcriptional regulator n=1 Tax=Paenibacillus sp. FSL R10-2734 TaxID=2954691 RepID=UPI0030D98B8A
MSGFVTIDKLSTQIGLTSRTLRHWEAQGLFESHREASSGWRIYDEHAILAIRITALLRKLDISIKDIGTVLQNMSVHSLYETLLQQSASIHNEKSELTLKEREIHFFLQLISARMEEPITNHLLLALNAESCNTLDDMNENEEVVSMTTIKHSPPIHVRFITLPPMRFAYNVAVSTSPEDEAMVPIVEWLETNHLLGTARLFGGNTNPHPSGENKPYGYGFCASIPENVEIPAHLKEIRFDGGLYAMTESSDDIFGSWQALMSFLDNNMDYQADHNSRLCLEEHIRNDNPKGNGNQYVLNLLEPVKKRS